MKYIVQINCKDGVTRFVSWKRSSYRPTLVQSRSQATQVDCQNVASILSDQFWSHNWVDELYNTRQVTSLKPKGKPCK